MDTTREGVLTQLLADTTALLRDTTAELTDSRAIREEMAGHLEEVREERDNALAAVESLVAQIDEQRIAREVVDAAGGHCESCEIEDLRDRARHAQMAAAFFDTLGKRLGRRLDRVLSAARRYRRQRDEARAERDEAISEAVGGTVVALDAAAEVVRAWHTAPPPSEAEFCAAMDRLGRELVAAGVLTEDDLAQLDASADEEEEDEEEPRQLLWRPVHLPGVHGSVIWCCEVRDGEAVEVVYAGRWRRPDGTHLSARVLLTNDGHAVPDGWDGLALRTEWRGEHTLQVWLRVDRDYLEPWLVSELGPVEQYESIIARVVSIVEDLTDGDPDGSNGHMVDLPFRWDERTGGVVYGDQPEVHYLRPDQTDCLYTSGLGDAAGSPEGTKDAAAEPAQGDPGDEQPRGRA